MRFILVFSLIIFFVSQCRFSREIEEVGEEEFYNCGHYEHHLFFEKESVIEYPDLGKVLAHAEELDLSLGQKRELTWRAAECFELCTLAKEEIDGEINALKSEAALKNLELRQLTDRVGQISSLEQTWLTGHQQRYSEAVDNILSESQKERWKAIEKLYHPLDGNF